MKERHCGLVCGVFGRRPDMPDQLDCTYSGSSAARIFSEPSYGFGALGTSFVNFKNTFLGCKKN